MLSATIVSVLLAVNVVWSPGAAANVVAEPVEATMLTKNSAGKTQVSGTSTSSVTEMVTAVAEPVEATVLTKNSAGNPQVSGTSTSSVTESVEATATAAVTSASSVAAQSSVKERCERFTMKNQGLEREYYLYRPEGLKDGAPLVIVLHGYGGSALKGKKEMMDIADRNGFAVCYPQGIKDPKGKPGWNVRYPSQEGMKTDDVKFLVALSKEVQKKFSLSAKNTFLTGMSNGGDIIYLIAMRAPKAFKAMASIAGLQFSWMETEYSYKHPLPFMEVHGTEDRVSEWLGDPENKGGWGPYIPVPAAVARVIAVNGCTEEYVTELPRREGRNQVTLYQFKGGKPAVKGGRPTEVWLYKVDGGDHSWSDKDLDTCSEIWRFFSLWLEM